MQTFYKTMFYILFVVGLNFAAENLKSLLLTFALINHRIDVETAVELSRLETLFQVLKRHLWQYFLLYLLIVELAL